VRPPGGRLAPQPAREISRLARAPRQRVIDLSSRATFICAASPNRVYAPLIEGLDALGLIDENRGERTPDIVLSPFWSRDDGSVDWRRQLAKSGPRRTRRACRPNSASRSTADRAGLGPTCRPTSGSSAR